MYAFLKCLHWTCILLHESHYQSFSLQIMGPALSQTCWVSSFLLVSRTKTKPGNNKKSYCTSNTNTCACWFVLYLEVIRRERWLKRNAREDHQSTWRQTTDDAEQILYMMNMKKKPCKFAKWFAKCVHESMLTTYTHPHTSTTAQLAFLQLSGFRNVQYHMYLDPILDISEKSWLVKLKSTVKKTVQYFK